MKYIYLFFLLFFISFNCAADVYYEENKNGATVFSDQPLSDNARKIDNSELNQTSTVETPTANTNATTEQTNSPNKNIIKKPYTAFKMVSPVNQETIQNQPSISVSMAIDPALQRGDKIQIYLDSVPWGAPLASTNFSFPAPERGTHTISARLIDSNQLTIDQTSPITVYIHHTHL